MDKSNTMWFKCSGLPCHKEKEIKDSLNKRNRKPFIKLECTPSLASLEVSFEIR